jgi:hypothetical protein
MTDSDFDQRISRALEQLSQLGIINPIENRYHFRLPHGGFQKGKQMYWTFHANRFAQLYQESRNQEMRGIPQDITIEKADMFTNLRKDYIYIWWNGLEVGKYAQSTPFIFIPAQRIPMGILAGTIHILTEIQGFGMAFPHWRDGTWRTAEIFSTEKDTYFNKMINPEGFRYTLNVHQGFDYLRSIWGEGNVGGNSESSVGYRAYAIKIEDLNESELGEVILPLNYALKGFDLNRDTQV